MPAHILQVDHESVVLDYADAASVIASFSRAVEGLSAKASRSGGSVAWSTLAADVDVTSVTDSRVSERHVRVMPGRSTLTVRASLIFEVA